jgi:hypothetical protein
MDLLYKNMGGISVTTLIIVSGAIFYWLRKDMKRQKAWREKKLRDIEQKKARIARKAAVDKTQ